MPDDRSSGQNNNHHSSSQTPTGSNAQAIILPSGMASVEKRPIPVVLFCAECVYSLTDVENYLQCGVPVLVVHVSYIFTFEYYFGWFVNLLKYRLSAMLFL